MVTDKVTLKAGTEHVFILKKIKINLGTVLRCCLVVLICTEKTVGNWMLLIFIKTFRTWKPKLPAHAGRMSLSVKSRY